MGGTCGNHLADSTPFLEAISHYKMRKVAISGAFRMISRKLKLLFRGVVNAVRQKLDVQRGPVALVICITLLLGGCAMQSKELKAMLESSVPTTQLTMGREVNRSYQDRGVTLGKPIPAEVRIKYEPKGNYTESDVFDEIIGILEQDSWEREELSVDEPGFYRASLLQDGFLIRATVHIQKDGTIVSVRLRTYPR
jgi:hypothetical protein